MRQPVHGFADRRDAGRQLAASLAHYRGAPHCIVLALPRGGVPVAAEVAGQLNLPLDVLVVRKLGAPSQPELAMGAIASGGVTIMNAEVAAHFAERPELVDAVIARERAELQRREHSYRGERSPLAVGDATCILIDDGAATGASMRAAVQALRKLKAKHIVVALPVCAREAHERLASEADEIVCPLTPTDFYAVGQWYDDFKQTTDAEVRAALDANARERRA